MINDNPQEPAAAPENSLALMDKNKTTTNPQSQVSSRYNNSGLFKPGQSGNPGGMPKNTVSLVRLLKKRLTENPSEADSVVDALISSAKSSYIPAIKELIDRTDGKATETHRIEGDLPVTLRFVPAALASDNHATDITVTEEAQ